MASTGIAAELLHNGTTVHKRLCHRRNVNSSSQITIDAESGYADILRRCHGIIIDEISMQHKDVLEYVDRLFRTLAKTPLERKTSFAGKVNNFYFTFYYIYFK